MSTYRKKLIEVALPLEAINKASAREKSIRHGHPSTLHLWWARRPLAACRAVLFASLVNDPEDDPMYGVDENTAYTERAKLFDLIEELVLWENSNNPTVINAARLEIARSIAANKVADKELADDTPLVANAPELPEEQAKYLPDPPAEYTPKDVRFKMPSLKPEQVNHFLAHYAPPVLDPFAGGGSIPLEAQRLGLRAYASDLNPVPVLINKALIEIPPKFAGQPPVNPDAQKGRLKTKQWHGAQGLAEDVRYYGKWMRDEAEKRIGHLYPKVKVTQQMVDDGRPDLEPYVGQELTVIAWLWARTVKSPNPAATGTHVPLISSFWLSRKPARLTYVGIEQSDGSNTFEFRVKTGKPSNKNVIDQGTVGRTGATCLLTKSPIPFDYVRDEAKAGRTENRLMAVAAMGNRQRVYFSPDIIQQEAALKAVATGYPETDLPDQALGFRVQLYGMDEHWKMFTARQLVAITTFSDLVSEAAQKVSDDTDRPQYGNAVATYLAFALSRTVDRSSTICTWDSSPKMEALRNTYARHALQMTWDFAEGNPFSDSSGNWMNNVEWVSKVLDKLHPGLPGVSRQGDATKLSNAPSEVVVSTDPPYYDNIGYADLSDFFYVWLRRSLGSAYSELSTMLTPKTQEMIATPYRHGGDMGIATEFFETGLHGTAVRIREEMNEAFPTSVYYAFKQAETTEDSGAAITSSTGWETILKSLVEAGMCITATWPVRTEMSNRNIGRGTNALASSIVLVCRKRSDKADLVTRREFANALRGELPEAIRHLQSGNVAPVDLAQASIGPGMAVFSSYSKVVNADGSPMSVREALQLINQVLDESLVEQESDFDSETRFALRWFEQYGMQEGPFGDAETLAKAMAVSVSGVVEAGIAKSGAGRVRLLKREELDPDWNPKTDTRLTMWEVTQYLIHRLETGGEMAAAELVRDVSGERGEIAKELAYRLYQTCDRKKWAEEARRYNAFVASWPEIVRLSRQQRSGQTEMEFG